MTARIVAALALLAGCAAADEPARERIHFSALDRNEKPRPGLDASDFVLRVDGRQTPLESFQAGRPHTGRTAPLLLWILLDSTVQTSSRLVADQADAAGRIFDLLGPDSAVGVSVVSDRVETPVPLGRDAEAVRRAFRDFGRTRSEVSARPAPATV